MSGRLREEEERRLALQSTLEITESEKKQTNGSHG